ncbi:MAG TPA: hypothetical protein VN428_05485 [Bryobacteraceae bacterium]|nr:hypothetical protein [Bryobacteraceae bacterium]
MQDHFQGVLDYEAQLNRREAADAAARPDPAFRTLQLQAESQGRLFGAAYPEMAAEAFITRVQAELRNRRKLAVLVPELASVEMEATFARAVAARIAEGGDILRRQIESRHYRVGPTAPPEVARRSGPELVAAHDAAVEAQRRNEPPDFRRMFPQQALPDLGPVDRFRARAEAVFAVIQTEFGLMRLRAGGVPDPNESAGFQHIPIHLVAVIRSIGTDLESLRKNWPDAAAFSDAVQNLMAAVVRTDEPGDGQRLEIVRLLHSFIEMLLLSLKPGGASQSPLAGRGAQDLDRVIARVPALAPAWSRCTTEVAALFDRPCQR